MLACFACLRPVSVETAMNTTSTAPEICMPRQSDVGIKPTLVRQPGGRGALLSGGQLGNKGGGRPRDEFKAKMAALASSDEAYAYLAECLRGDHGPAAFLAAFKLTCERGYGKATTHAEPPGSDGPCEIRIIRTIVDPSDR
jgi:hypothetical protein